MEIRVLAIINPTSGRGNITGYVEQIKKYLEKQNMTVKVKFTKKEYNARKIVINNIEETDLILVCGGDGTFNETVSALMELETKDISIAYIPMGTTNDLAQSLKIPIKD
ncbi:MAG: diacylglycerol/lipid kinase family protein, partial [Clostridia bacterium]